MIRAVLDTNIVVSAHLSPQGASALIFNLAMSRYFRCFVSSPLLEEYGDVLGRARFGLDGLKIPRVMRRFREAAILVTPRKKLRITVDPYDNKVVECALAARADYIVTGNIRLFPVRFQDIRIIPPREFLTVLASDPN